MIIKTHDLAGPALDYAVAIIQKLPLDMKDEGQRWVWNEASWQWLSLGDTYSPSTRWEQGGPIIESHITKLFKNVGGTYTAQVRHEKDHPLTAGPVISGWINRGGHTPLIAAMRCYVASKLGNEVDIPSSIINQGE